MLIFGSFFGFLHRIPLSLRTRGEIDLEEAKRQHEAYVRWAKLIFFFVLSLSDRWHHQISTENFTEIDFAWRVLCSFQFVAWTWTWCRRIASRRKLTRMRFHWRHGCYVQRNCIDYKTRRSKSHKRGQFWKWQTEFIEKWIAICVLCRHFFEIDKNKCKKLILFFSCAHIRCGRFRELIIIFQNERKTVHFMWNQARGCCCDPEFSFHSVRCVAACNKLAATMSLRKLHTSFNMKCDGLRM